MIVLGLYEGRYRDAWDLQMGRHGAGYCDVCEHYIGAHRRCVCQVTGVKSNAEPSAGKAGETACGSG